MRAIVLLCWATLAAAEAVQARLAEAAATDPLAAAVVAADQLAATRPAGGWSACLLLERVGSDRAAAAAIGAAVRQRLGCPVFGWGGGSGAGSPTWAGIGAKPPSVQLLAFTGVRIDGRLAVGAQPAGLAGEEAAARGRALAREAPPPADAALLLYVGCSDWSLWNRSGAAWLRAIAPAPAAAVAARASDWVYADGAVGDGALVLAFSGPGLQARRARAVTANAADRAGVIAEARAAAAEAAHGLRVAALLAFSSEDRFRLTSFYDPAVERAALAEGAGVAPFGGYTPGATMLDGRGRLRGDSDLVVVALGTAP